MYCSQLQVSRKQLELVLFSCHDGNGSRLLHASPDDSCVQVAPEFGHAQLNNLVNPRVRVVQQRLLVTAARLEEWEHFEMVTN